ncbi:MAG: UDP-N-acetylmuramoyl-L-alanyl-D-glutamate--2,6-diaminopimelate ligase [Rickettsiales bacterium]|nr:UDP-N-acetylmuramoyl-L-alanyl-D-glutamate--2,6-diaminopimelate ligase [Rickettsiales bacterium]
MLLNVFFKDQKGGEVLGIQTDSRLVKDGYIFFAIDGTTKGIDYADMAIKGGAMAVVCEDKYDFESDKVPVIKVPDAIKELARCLNILYPSKSDHIIGITGTSGKTSTTEFTRQIIEKLGYNSASIGSLGVKYGNEYKKDDTATTKLWEKLHEELFLLKKKNIDYVVTETTSIGLVRRRTEGLNIEIGAFLNFTQDHLDFHTNMKDYFDSKMLLFRDVLKNGSPVVLNADIPEFEKISEICAEKQHKILSVGYNGDLKILDIKEQFNGQHVKIQYQNNNYEFDTHFIGKFQVYNLLIALGIVLQLNIENDINKIIATFEFIKSANGRLELAGRKKNGAQIYIDYAHKPDAIEKVLTTMRDHIKNVEGARLGILFGCGGDRDKTKRPIMGKIANDLADFVIVTDDNPRNEVAETIRDEIMAACPGAMNIGDRKQAIKKAIEILQPKDVLILAGKGHENYTIIGNKTYPFDEFEIVREFIN